MAFTILVVDDEENARKPLEGLLTKFGYEVVLAGTMAEAREKLKHGVGDVVVLDVLLPDGYGPNLLLETARMPDSPPIIMITARGNIEMAVDAMKNGAHDFLQKPIDINLLEQSIQKACAKVSMKRELDHYRQMHQLKGNFVAGNSPVMIKLFEQAHKAAQAAVSVLITGETGVGKDIMAQFIWQNGPRAQKPFYPINCAAIQNTMLESELFGYEHGAFTGADRRKIGLMQEADTGVLFLDEISSMPLDMQAKLLRAIETKAFMRVGGNTLVKVDVQILAASNRDLKKMMRDNQFREDLYYRLKFVDLDVPPLRERKEDLPELVGFIIRQANMQYGKRIQDVTPRAMKAIMEYHWPGNIRELRNTIEKAMIFCDSDVIDIANLSLDVIKVEA
ncbi:MAG TPA: sigma-54 dependent transcriptional regulator [Anaerolineaceae bacterium]|nr:sigma-54 dependent transcriptional regulator [Anaerolineaceae bacterium]